MQTHHKEATPVFLNTTVNKEGTTFMCALKQENASIEETCQLASPTFDSPVKRPLIDSGHAMTTPHTKRVKQERDWDPSFWENKERLLLSNKTSLQSIVSEVAHSFESVKNPSFQGMEASDFESSNLNPSGALDETIALGRKFESSPPIAAVTKEVGHGNVEALAPTVDSHKENISVLSPIADQVSQAEATKPILRALKSLESGISDGYAFDHNFFPKLIGVHSVSSPTSSSIEVESHLDSQQICDVPRLKKLVQDEKTNDSSPLQNGENDATSVSIGNFIRHCAVAKGHAIPTNIDKNVSHVTPFLSRTQNSSTTSCDANLYTRDVHVGSKVRAQTTPRALPIIPLALATDSVPEQSSVTVSPPRAELSYPDSWIDANMFSQPKQVIEQQRTTNSFAERSSFHGNHATTAAHAQTRGRVVDSTSQLFPVLSQVNPTDQSLIYSNEQTSTSSKKLRSVNMQEVVNIYRMAANASSRADPIRQTAVHSPSDSPSQKPCDLLFSFMKQDGKSDMFLVVNDEVFAVRRFDYKGNSYLIHTDKKGKTSILAKLPEDEKSKLQNNGTSATTGQQLPAKRKRPSNITPSGSDQSGRASQQRVTSQHPAEGSLIITSLQNSFLQTFSGAKARDTAPTTSGQWQGIPRGMRSQNRQENTPSLNEGGVLSESQSVYNDMRTQSENRQLLNQVLNGVRAGTSGHRQRPLVTSWPQSVPTAQQHFLSQARARNQIGANDSLQSSTAVPINAHLAPGTAHPSFNNWNNQQLTVNPNQSARNQGNDAINAYSQEQYTNTAAQSTYSGVSTGQQRYYNEETVDVDIYGNSTCGNPSPENENRIMQRIKLMNYIAHRLASKADEHASSMMNGLDYLHSASRRRHEAAKQIPNGTIAHELNNRTTYASTSRSHQEPPPQQYQQIRDLLVGTPATTINSMRNFRGVDYSSRKRAAESSQFAQTLTCSRPAPLVSKMLNGANDRSIIYEDESRLAVDQLHPIYVDATDSLIDDGCRPGITGQQLLNERRQVSGLQSGEVSILSPVSPGTEVSGFLHELVRPGNDAGFDEQYFTSSVSGHPSRSSTSCESFMTLTSDHGKSLSVNDSQRYYSPGKNTSVNQKCVENGLVEAVQRTGPSLEGHSVSAFCSGQQICIDDAPVRGTAEVAKQLEADETDEDVVETDDDVVEIIEPPPKRDSVSNTSLDSEDESESDKPMEEDADKRSNSALRAELVKKIHSTCERIAEEQIDWKKKYLYKMKTALEKKLAHVSGVAEVIVIDDD